MLARQRSLATPTATVAAAATGSSSALHDASTTMLRGIRSVTDALGRDVTCHASAQDEECERELEKEQEEEEEREVEKAAPRADVDWDVGAALAATNCEQLQERAPAVALQSLDSFVRARDKAVSSLAWASARVFGTGNFFLPLAQQRTAASDGLADYLRPVSSALVFPAGDVLLLSEREVDAVLHHVWYRARPTDVPARAPALVHLTFAKLAAAAGGSNALMTVPATGAAVTVPPAALAHMQVFAGDTMFADSLKDHVEKLAPSKVATAAASSLPYVRGTLLLLDRSHLEAICARVNVRLHAAELAPSAVASPAGAASASTSTGATPSSSAPAGAASATGASA